MLVCLGPLRSLLFAGTLFYIAATIGIALAVFEHSYGKFEELIMFDIFHYNPGYIHTYNTWSTPQVGATPGATQLCAPCQ